LMELSEVTFWCVFERHGVYHGSLDPQLPCLILGQAQNMRSHPWRVPEWSLEEMHGRLHAQETTLERKWEVIPAKFNQSIKQSNSKLNGEETNDRTSGFGRHIFMGTVWLKSCGLVRRSCPWFPCWFDWKTIMSSVEKLDNDWISRKTGRVVLRTSRSAKSPQVIPGKSQVRISTPLCWRKWSRH
jgi:hypothetical protein